MSQQAKRALQLFSDESLARSREMGIDEILRFLEDFRLMYAKQIAQSEIRKQPPPAPSKQEN